MDDSLQVGSQMTHGHSRHGRPKVTPEVQCAYYAIERFRSSWKVSHVSGIYLKGDYYSVSMKGSPLMISHFRSSSGSTLV